MAPIAAFFLSGLKVGGLIMQRAVGLESTVVEAIQGLVIIFVAASLALQFDRDDWRRFLVRRKLLDAGFAQSATNPSGGKS